ncbi:MAG: universal stress protein [Rhodobacteraceae bacterium]|nr:universal stress protein [Paracoccaceae bacterium]
MAYKTLLTVIRSADEAALQISASAALARQHDAHLDILCLGIDEVQMGYYFAGADAVLQETSIAMAKEKAEGLVKSAEGLAAKEDVRYAVRGMVSQYGVLNEVVGHAARFADLVVLPRPYGKDASLEKEAILEAALFSGRAPVLVVPETGLPDGFPRLAVIGWNASNEALTAVRGALPFLKAASEAVVAIIDPPKHSPDQSDPGDRISTLLDRHGVKAEVVLLAKSMPKVSDVLLQQIADSEADLLVTGAYGHSRFREAILGGATRDLLEGSPVPVLMAH